MAARKILMITYSYYPAVGGGIRYQKDLVDYFRTKGNIVDVLTISNDKNMYINGNDGGSIIEMPQLAKISSATISMPYFHLFGKLATGYDILHFNFPNPIAEMAAIRHKRKLKNVKKIVFYHADIVPAKRFSGIYNRLITPRFLKLMDDIIVSNPNLSKFSPHLAPFKEKVSVIPFGIDLNYYTPALPDQSGVQEASQRTPNILFVGRLSRYKGIDYLIRAMKGLQGKLSIIGEGPLKDSLAQLATNLDMKEQIEFCGHVSDETLLQKYQEADILVLPSTDAGEAFGYVLIEAMACRTALISTELNTGTSYVNINDETGFVVSPKDVGALSKAISTLIEDSDMLTQFKDNALGRAREFFSLQRMLTETEELYNRKQP
jgi:glycosyltransferase involved in cell wall biosynthesis